MFTVYAISGGGIVVKEEETKQSAVNGRGQNNLPAATSATQPVEQVDESYPTGTRWRRRLAAYRAPQ